MYILKAVCPISFKKTKNKNKNKKTKQNKTQTKTIQKNKKLGLY